MGTAWQKRSTLRKLRSPLPGNLAKQQASHARWEDSE